MPNTELDSVEEVKKEEAPEGKVKKVKGSQEEDGSDDEEDEEEEEITPA